MVKRAQPTPPSQPSQPSQPQPPGSEGEPIYQLASYNRENSVGYLMRRIVHLMVGQVDRRLEGTGLTHAQWAPLFMIDRGEANTLAALARDLRLDAGALTRTLDRLEAKGLCRRERSADDRRVVHLALTPQGQEAAAPVPGVLCEVSNALLEGFTHAEWETLMGFLRRMAANAEALRDAPLTTAQSPDGASGGASDGSLDGSST